MSSYTNPYGRRVQSPAPVPVSDQAPVPRGNAKTGRIQEKPEPKPVTETYVNAWGREIARTVSETVRPEPRPATPRTPDPNAPTHSLAELLESGFRSFRLTRQQPDGTWEPVPGCVVWPAPKP